MSKKQGSTYLSWIFFVALQIFIFNDLTVLNKYIINVYLYMLLMEHTCSPIYNIFRGFFLGLIIDLFNCTFGMHAAACVAITFAANLIVGLQTKDKFNDAALPLNIKSLGIKKSIVLYFFLILIHQSVYLLMDNWSYPITMQLIYRILFSTFITSNALLTISIIAYLYNKKTNYKEM